jgi:hypothetical protein
MRYIKVLSVNFQIPIDQKELIGRMRREGASILLPAASKAFHPPGGRR